MIQDSQVQTAISAGIFLMGREFNDGAPLSGSSASSATLMREEPTTPPVHCFEIYCQDRVSVTSTLFCGGDWRWALRAPTGLVLAQGRGFHSEADCLEAIAALRKHSALAPLKQAAEATQ